MVTHYGFDLESTKDADTVLKVFRNISSLSDVFQVSFCMEKLFVYIDNLVKIDTQLHTEVKVEEIFKVFPRSLNNALNFNCPVHSDWNHMRLSPTTVQIYA